MGGTVECAWYCFCFYLLEILLFTSNNEFGSVKKMSSKNGKSFPSGFIVELQTFVEELTAEIKAI